MSQDESLSPLSIHSSPLSFSDKKGERCQAEFNAFFDAAPNPYDLALKFFTQGVNYQDAKAKSFTFYVLEALDKYAKQHPERHSILDDSLKMVAYNLTNKDPNSSLFKLAASCFRFPESAHLFEEKVRNLMVQHKYVLAARFAQHCGVVHPDFVHGFLIPITFSRSHVSVVYDYLEMATALQVPLLKALDSLMTPSNDGSFFDMIQMYGYQDLPRENLNNDYLRKNIPKLRKKFKLPVDATPNVHKQQNQGALEYWIQQLATGEALPMVFEDNVKSLVSQDNVECQVLLITKLLSRNLGLECRKWMDYYNISLASLPAEIQNRITYAERNQMHMGSSLEKRGAANLYSLDPRRVEQRFVSNPTSFKKMLSVLGADTLVVIAFDLEWKPTYNEHSEMALIQLATESYVFVVDKLSMEISEELWRQLGAILNRTDAVIVGFGCLEDLAKLAKDRALGIAKSTLDRIVDFANVWQVLKAKYKDILKESPTPGAGLKDLVKAYLNKNLDKRLTMSDWSLRPLRPEQIKYAAADAFVLVDVFMEVKRRLEAHNVDFYSVLETKKKGYRR